MPEDQSELRATLDRVFAAQDMIDACHRRDVGGMIRVFRKYGISQGKIAGLVGITQGRLSEYNTGKHLPTLDTYEKLADGLGMPPSLRSALGLSPSALDDSSAGNGFSGIADTFDLQLLAEEIGRRGDSVKRREMLSLAATIGATAAIAQGEIWERIAYALAKPTAMDESVIREMEARTAGFHRLEELLPASTLYKGLAAHLREVGTLLNGTTADPTSESRRRLIVVAGESSVLAGWAASDIGDIAAARNFYDTAESAAREANDLAIAACANAYRSYIPSTKGNRGRSRALLANAITIMNSDSSSASGSPSTMAWLSARHAEESAALGDNTQALASWEQATEAFAIADPEEDRVWTRFLDRNRFDSYHIATYTRIPEKLGEAEQIAHSVLERLEKPERKKAAIIFEDMASAHLSRGSVIEAARLAKSGLAVLRDTEFAMWLPRYETMALGMRKWQRQPAVRSFLEDLALTKRQFAASRH